MRAFSKKNSRCQCRILTAHLCYDVRLASRKGLTVVKHFSTDMLHSNRLDGFNLKLFHWLSGNTHGTRMSAVTTCRHGSHDHGHNDIAQKILAIAGCLLLPVVMISALMHYYFELTMGLVLAGLILSAGLSICVAPSLYWIVCGTTRLGARVIEYSSLMDYLNFEGISLWPCILLRGPALTGQSFNSLASLNCDTVGIDR